MSKRRALLYGLASVAVGGGFAFAATSVVVWLFPQEETVIPLDSYDPGLYTPFTHAPTQPTRPPHPFSVYRPPGYEGR